MNSKENEYREIFLAEAESNHEELNKLLTALEKKPDDQSAINAIFRITHTLKGNAAGMGFDKIAEFSHMLEDLFGFIREGKVNLDAELFATLFKSLDTLEKLIYGIRDGKEVRILGIKTKLKVLLDKVDEQPQSQEKQKPEKESKNKKSAKKKSTVKSKSQSSAKKAKPTAQSAKEEESNSTASTDSDPTNSSNPKVEEASPQADDEHEVQKMAFSDLVQVPVKKLDNLLNLVGELIIERDRIIASHSGMNASNEYARLNRISSDLQYSVMDVRLVQVGFLFNKFHRVVRDAANSEKKKVDLILEGTETEIDRNILQIISDSLIHLIRNSVGHGVELPEERKKANKPETGKLTLKAFAEKDAVYIEIKDDGKGIDIEKVKQRALEKGLINDNDLKEMSDRDASLLIFEPGFSTMDQVTSISGRGVGMDVVKKALDNVGGTISVDTIQGQGTTVSLRLPASMAVKGTLLFDVNEQQYAIPLSYTESVVSLYKTDIHSVGQRLAAVHSGETISIVFLKDLFDATSSDDLSKSKTFEHLHPEHKLDIVIVNHNGRKVGFVVDKLFQQKEIVEKPLAKPVDKTYLFSGVTIMGNGNVCLVINVVGICNTIFSRSLSNQGKISY